MRPSRPHGGGRAPDRRPGAPCRHRGAAPPTRPAGDRRSTPRASMRAASQPATSATARACRTSQGGGSRESSREAASTRPGTVIVPMVPDDVRRGRDTAGTGRRTSRGRRGRGARPAVGNQAGDRDRTPEGQAAIAVAARSRLGARRRPSAEAGTAAPAGRSGSAAMSAVAAPSVRTVISSASNPTTTVPSRSVRRTRAPAAASRSSVALAGWPYGLPAPADATATFGRTASTKGSVVAVRLP